MTRTPAGLSPVSTSRSTPSLPAASIAWSTNSTRSLALGEQSLLQFGDLADHDGQLGLGRFLVPSERVAGVVVGDSMIAIRPAVDRAIASDSRGAEPWRPTLPVGSNVTRGVAQAGAAVATVPAVR